MTVGIVRGAVAPTAPRDPQVVHAVRLHHRSALVLAVVTVLGAVSFCWPLFVRHAAQANGHNADAPYLVALLLVLLVALVLAELADGGIDAKALAMLGVLAAAGSVARLLDPGFALGEGLVFFLLIPSGRVLGRGFGFCLGALTLFASALLTIGVGPWLPFQMLAAGWFGFLGGCLPARLRGRTEVAALAALAFVASLGYGLVMDLSFWPFRIGSGAGPLQFQQGAALTTNLRHFWAFHLTSGAGYDTLRGLSAAVLVLLTATPLLAALRRAARRAAFDVPVVFED